MNKVLIFMTFMLLSFSCASAGEQIQYNKLCVSQKLCESRYVIVDFSGNYGFVKFHSVAGKFEKNFKLKSKKSNRLYILGYSESKKIKNGKDEYWESYLKYSPTEILNVGIRVESHDFENKLLVTCFIHLTYRTANGDYITERVPNDLYFLVENTESMKRDAEEKINNFINSQVIETIAN